MHVLNLIKGTKLNNLEFLKSKVFQKSLAEEVTVMLYIVF